MTRRGHGEGSIFLRKDGLWAAVIDLGYNNGRRSRVALYAKTRREVHERLASALRAKQQGLRVAPERQTVEQYLRDWLNAKRGRVRARTWQRYEQYVRIHAVPIIGRLPLAGLGPEHVQQLLDQRLKEGVSAASVHHLRAVLRTALAQAERWNKVPRNAAALVDAPTVARREMKTLSPTQARQLLATAAGDRLEALYVLAITTGMRQGELLGLRWTDVGFDSADLMVRATLQRTSEGYVLGEPKTSHSRRRITLGTTAVAALRRHRISQAEDRLAIGSGWRDGDFVFTNEAGGPLDATNVLRRSFHPLLTRAGLPRIRFHDLRHTAATLLLGQGIHPKIVSEMLGHSQVAITLDLYSHVTPTMQQEAAAALDSVLAKSQ